MGYDNWNLSMIDMEGEAFARGCGDARFKLGWHGEDYRDRQRFADYACGFDTTLEDMLREEIDE